jgi:hypothetical protein
MPQYMLSAHTVDGQAREPMSEEQVRRSMGQIADLEREMKSSGTWIFGGRLHPPDTATVVRTANNEVVMTDGPFAESKEHLGGIYIIAADDLDTALAWAARVTALVGAPIEVRPFAEYPGA